jgi:hypothetical protein
MTNLVEKLKEHGEDFEFYPTAKEMIKPIVEHMAGNQNTRPTVLDIGAGTCNFRSHFNELKDKDQRISDYFVIEKSRVLIERLHKDVIVMGTDFHMTTLIDKKVDVIFCNPPYSEFVEWTQRIIWEGNAEYIYLVIPERWKENKEILRSIETSKSTYKILGSFDFLNAERRARAKVDIVCITKPRSRCEENTQAFDTWFDETFKTQSEYEAEKEKQEEVRRKALVAGENKAEILVNLYQEEQKRLYEAYLVISGVDVEILKEVGVTKSSVKSSLKEKIKNLKILYWKMIFENLDQITDRLTKSSREKLLDKFTRCNQVDFTYDNIYALIIWVIKNANTYYNEQLVELFKNLSDEENVKPYKSNQKTFKQEKWRYNRNENTHYTLDYRIVCSAYSVFRYSWKRDEINEFEFKNYIGDFLTIANNLGFEVGMVGVPKKTGEKETVLMKNGKTLFEYRVYKNHNMHIKCNIEFMKALNVEAARLLGWIRDKEDIKREFDPKMAEGAEKYFKANTYLSLGGSGLKLLGVNPAA